MPFSSNRQRKWFFANHPEYGDNKSSIGSRYQGPNYQLKSRNGTYFGEYRPFGTSHKGGGLGFPRSAETTWPGAYDAFPRNGQHEQGYSKFPLFDKKTEEFLQKLSEEQKLGLLRKIVEGRFLNQEYGAVSRSLSKILAEEIVPKDGTVTYRYVWVDWVKRRIEEGLNQYAPERLPKAITELLWGKITRDRFATLPDFPKPDPLTPAGTYSTLDQLQYHNDTVRANRDWYIQNRVFPPQGPPKASYPEIPWLLQKLVGTKPGIEVKYLVDWQNIPRNARNWWRDTFRKK